MSNPPPVPPPVSPPVSPPAPPPAPSPAFGHQETLKKLNALIVEAGGDPDTFGGGLVRQMMHTALKLIGDRRDLGQLKIIGRSIKELRYAMKVFAPYEPIRKVAVFGSARTPVGHPDYTAAETFSRHMAESGWMIITGAGDGIMRAGNGGAGRAASFGVSIRLPFETTANDVIIDDPKLINFRYFFTRKLMFTSQSHAVALFPGGFGTHDEGFEVLTLVQTGKSPTIPIVCVDHPGGTYWQHWDQYIRKSLLENGWISPEDTHLYHVTDDIAVARRIIRDFYRNYHSQRFVNDTFVMRLHRPVTSIQLDQLNDEFADLVKSGKMTQGGPLPKEHGEFPDLVRIYFHSTKRSYGKLRLLIDRVNAFDALNTAETTS